ncbi:MAG TPA: phosphoribosylamine--glycine ligase [Clostridia bacterium]|nr:phosphoribosylamine--glycine ligase [Clostridia bacterium]
MNIMIVGGGGREHAILEKLRENPRIEKIYALPGNGGMAAHAECVPIRATDIDGIVRFAAEKHIDFAVIGPDDPLIAGVCDRLRANGIRCFGPSKAAAAIEGSKSFAKNLMRKYGIPTADYAVFDRATEAYAYLAGANYPVVIKADGPALGKGVIIADNREEAFLAVRGMMEEGVFGASGSHVVVEEFLTGVEASVLAFTDGTTLIPMISALDHKRALDGDKGLNTGGMGALAPNPYYTLELARSCMELIFLPTIRAMSAELRPFSGCLFFGLMLTRHGPKVIEYNCRFGDPETQAVLPLLETDLLEIMLATEEGRLAEVPVRFRGGSACCVVLASEGYPGAYQTGYEISLGDANRVENVLVYHAGTKLEQNRLVTAGGRVLGVTAVGPDARAARYLAYSAAGKIRFEHAFYRRDIGARAIATAEQGEQKIDG